MNSARTNTAAKKPCHSLGAQSVNKLATAVAATSHLCLRFAFVCVLLVSIAGPAQAQMEHVVYSFTGGMDGANPGASLIWDRAGNLYSTTYSGGAYGQGTVFSMSSSGVETVLYAFTGGADGANPYWGLIQDAHGNLYSTTELGGAYGKGTVFAVSPSGVEKVIYSFTGGRDGAYPEGGLIRDRKGYFYGTTNSGGDYGWGTVFRLSPSGFEKVLYSFRWGADGAFPAAGLIQDAAGNLYGTTYAGGAYSQGTVFSVSPSGVEKVIYSFTGGADGALPMASLIWDANGNLYGTTPYGNPNDWGTVFRVSPNGTEQVLYSFVSGAQGQRPSGSLIWDAQGNLYGTAPYGGAYGYGTVFVITPSGGEKTLHNFTGGIDGSYPAAGLIWDANGNLYGTTYYGGAYGYGTVFVLTP